MSGATGLEVTARCALARDGAPYSFHEDIVLEAVVDNGRSDRVEIPHLSESDLVKLRLKSVPGGQVREENTLLPQPGVASLPATYPLEAGKEVTYRLLLQAYFGRLAAGQYEIQLAIDSPVLTFTSPWIPFEILRLMVSAPSAFRSAESEPDRLNLAWVDASAQPNRVLLRSYAIDNREQVIYTKRLGEADGPVRAIASPMAPPGQTGNIGWNAWVSGSTVSCLKTDDGSPAGLYTFPTGQPSRVAGPTLIYPAPASDETGCSVLLRPDAIDGPQFLTGLEISHAGALDATWKHVPATAPELVAVTHLGPELRWVIWSGREPDGKTGIRKVDWSRSKGFSNEQKLLTVAAPVLALAARSETGLVRIGVLAYQDPATGGVSPYSTGAVVMLETPAKTGEWKASKPSIHQLGLPEPPAHAALKLGGDGAGWVLARGAKSLWLAGTRLSSPVQVSVDKRATEEMLYVQWDQTPRVLYVDPVEGWTSVTPEVSP